MKTKFLYVAILLGLGAMNTLSAQADMSKWKLGIFGSILHYQGQAGHEIFKLKPSTAGVGLHFGRELNSSLDIEAQFMAGNLDFTTTTTAPETGEEVTTNVFDSKIYDLAALLVYNFDNGYILKEDAVVSPFIFAGPGVIRSNTGWGLVVPAGLGVNFRLDELFSIQVRSSYNWTTDKSYNFLQTSLGAMFHLGAKKQKDEGPKDSDGDGITDELDACPEVYGMEENNGCPGLDEETKTVLHDALEGVFFETGKDIIKTESYEVLDNVVDIMERHTEYKLSIEGHTDSSGDDTMNMNLSQRRANSVMKYMTDKGIAAKRLSATGYGETQPIADNGTAEGRAKNRRVEFNVSF